MSNENGFDSKKCSYIEGKAQAIYKWFEHARHLSQHHPPLDKSKQSTTKADFNIHDRKDGKEVCISLFPSNFQNQNRLLVIPQIDNYSRT